MRLTLLPILALFVGAVVFTSCKKETRIERNLWKSGGEWNIENYDYSSTTTNSSSNITLNLEDCGSFTFNKDGGGELVFSFFGTTETNPLTYTNTEDQLTLTIDSETTILDMAWEKNSMTINRTNAKTNNGETTTETESYILKKK